MLPFSKVTELQSRLSELKRKGKTVGLVPTMGALHAGHLSLVRRSFLETDVTVVSIFVNPTQFGPQEDFDQYPRPEVDDIRLLTDAGVQFLFHPPVEEIYPGGLSAATTVHVPKLGQRLCGKSRPKHFDGVSSVVARLLMIVMPDRAYFGEKDFQQLLIIRKMAMDLRLPGQILGCEIVRESDGLAYSSRNQYLSSSDREKAPELYHTLRKCRQLVDSGLTDAAQVLASAQSQLEKVFRVDYIEAVDPETLASVRVLEPGTRIMVAVYLGPTRLIDNIKI